MRYHILILFIFLATKSLSQIKTFPEGIAESNSKSKNINHSYGKGFQDVKKSFGFLKIRGEDGKIKESSCSCNLLNTVTQSKEAIIITAADCLKEYNKDDEINGFLSFDFEHPSAIEKGDITTDEYISKIYAAKLKVLVHNTNSNISLLKIVEDTYNDRLLKNAYTIGWDNTLLSNVNTHISHPKADHKKIYISPNQSEFKLKDNRDIGSGRVGKGFYYRI